MSDPINPTAADRAETRELCRRVIASVVEDEVMPLGLRDVGTRPGDHAVFLRADVEDLVMQLALEVRALQKERDGLVESLDAVCERCQDKCKHRSEP